MNSSSSFLLAIFMLASTSLQSAEAFRKTRQIAEICPESSVSVLAGLVNQRLSYMKDVAAYKWKHQLPIEDLEREQAVIRNSIERATAYGLDSASTRNFFEEQITAAKLIQQYWFDQWTAHGFDEQLVFRDLNSEVRPALLKLGDQILRAISELNLWKKSRRFISRNRFNFINSLTTEGLGLREKRLLYEAATQIEGR